MNKKALLIIAVACIFCWGGVSIFALENGITPVEKWGQLKVTGTQLTTLDGTPVELQGMSLFDSTSYGNLANAQSLTWMRDDWKVNVIRAAMYTEYNGQFVGSTAFNEEFKVIQAAIDAGIYVLVDWHVMSDGSPLKYKEQAKDFFSQVAQKYGKYPNVIYEICNEPQGGNVTWANAVKPYALELIPVIRAIAPQAIILVGSPQWSSQPHIASADPLPFNNVMYVLHYYAGSHDQGQYLSYIDQTIANGCAVFVTEWGTTTATVTPGLYFERSISWVNQLAKRKISWCNWSLSTKLEATSSLKPSANINGSWRNGELTENGLFLRALLRHEKTATIFADSFDSGNFKAGNWFRNGVMLDKTTFQAGTGSIRFEGTASLIQKLKAETISDVAVSMWYKTENIAKPDNLVIEYSLDGKNWKLVGSIASEQASKSWKKLDVSLPSSVNHVAELQIRLKTQNQNESAKFWIDEFEITATRANI